MTINSIRCAEIRRDCFTSDDGVGPRWMRGLFPTSPGLGTASLNSSTGETFVPDPGPEYPGTMVDITLCFCMFPPSFSKGTRRGRAGWTEVRRGRLLEETRVRLSSGVSALEIHRLEKLGAKLVSP